MQRKHDEKMIFLQQQAPTAPRDDGLQKSHQYNHDHQHHQYFVKKDRETESWRASEGYKESMMKKMMWKESVYFF